MKYEFENNHKIPCLVGLLDDEENNLLSFCKPVHLWWKPCGFKVHSRTVPQDPSWRIKGVSGCLSGSVLSLWGKPVEYYLLNKIFP